MPDGVSLGFGGSLWYTDRVPDNIVSSSVNIVGSRSGHEREGR